jgi:ABC-2 type transport system ATP-binding protein
MEEKVKDLPIIEVRNLTQDYGSGRGVFNVSFKIYKGECFGFLGPNGSGKSTTIRHIMGFSKPQKGKTFIFNQESFHKYYKILNRVGYIPGEIALPRGLNGFEVIKMIQDMQGIHNSEMLNKLLKLFELEPNQLKGDTKRMSLGVKRKLAIVLAFMSDPEVLILDEPTSGLDPVMQENFINFIKEEKARGKTILLSSHIFSEVDATCDRIAIIKDGKIVSEFIANDLKHATTKYYELTFLNKTNYCKFIKDANENNFFKLLNKDENKNYVFVSCEDKNINQFILLLNGFNIKDFNNVKETLKDYFMKFYKEDLDYKKGAL